MNRRTAGAGLLLAIATGIVVFVALDIVRWRKSTPVAPEEARNLPVSGSARQAPYADRDWESGAPSGLDISVFVYRDRNRNGEYDQGDLPMPGVSVSLLKPAGIPEHEQSNVNGYTNFRMHLRPGDSSISRKDAFYHFEVQTPPGWQVTSGNVRQSSRFRALAGSPAGLVAESPPDAVGLAPVLTISGSIEEADQLISLIATAPDNRRLQITPGPQGHFRFGASAGDWTLTATRADTPYPVVRQVSVADVPVALSSLSMSAAVTALPAKEHRIRETFDALPYSRIEKLPRGHNGLDWNYLLAVHNQTYHGPGYVNGMVSPPGVGYNSSGHPVTIAGLAPGDRFDFSGGFFSVAWPGSEGETLEVTGWRGPAQVYRDNITLSYLGPVWFQADYRDIDRLTLATSHYWQFVSDDLEFRLPTPQPGEAATVQPRIPWLSQYDVFPDDELAGNVMCAPTAAALALAQLGVSGGSRQESVATARDLAGAPYLATRMDAGTSPQQLFDGLRRYASTRGLRIEFIQYAGWRPVHGTPKATRLRQVSRDWLDKSLDNGAAVLLSIGAYARQADGSFARVGGHWVNLRAIDADTLLVHDPASAIVDPAGHRVLLQVERLRVADASRTRFYIGDTGAHFLDGLHLPPGADRLALDAAIALRISAQ